jgi:hypothetical protein
MSLYMDNDGRFPDDAAVMVRYPLPSTPADADRAVWPWVPGHVLGQCGPNEWHIVVDGPPELAEPHPDDPDGEPLFPACFRDASELRGQR